MPSHSTVGAYIQAMLGWDKARVLLLHVYVKGDSHGGREVAAVRASTRMNEKLSLGIQKGGQRRASIYRHIVSTLLLWQGKQGKASASKGSPENPPASPPLLQSPPDMEWRAEAGKLHASPITHGAGSTPPPPTHIQARLG